MRRAALLAALTLACLSGPAHAAPFDFYVLALSWSPSYCLAEGAEADRRQCDASRPHGFVVHGLWPQYEAGYPEFCARPAPRIPRRLIDSMLDIMPSPRLVIGQWRKHGTCSGTSAESYFATVRTARDRIKVPAMFEAADVSRQVAPEEVEAAFRAVNPGLPADAVAVSCDGRTLREVRICLTPDLEPRPCPNLDRRACRAAEVSLPRAP